ncbi:MAG: branched-chain amino acid ABC transporter permease [Chloroflexota bacterium]
MINRECGVYKTTYQGDMGFYRVPLARWSMVVIAVLAIGVVPLVATDYWFRAIILPFVIFSLAAIGLNLLAGYCGQVSLGHGAFMAVGGYTSAILYAYDLPFILSMILGGVMAAVVGLLFGIPSVRVKGLYLALATLAAQFALPWALSRTVPLFAPAGLALAGGDTLKPPALYIFGILIKSNTAQYYVCLAILAVMTILAMNLVRTRVGRAWIAIRDHDVAARILGYDITWYKLLAFAISSFYAGVAGSLMVFIYFGVAHIAEFSLNLSIEMLAVVIIGGMGSILGSFFGVAFIVFLPIFLNQLLTAIGSIGGFTISSGIISGTESLIFGSLIIMFLVIEPMGLAKLWANVRDYFRLWPFSY